MQSQVLLPLIFLSCYTFTILPALSALHQTHACSKSNASTAKPMAFALSHTLAPTSGTNFPKTSGTLLLSVPSKVNSRHFSSQNISVKPHCPSLLSVCTVCVCVCVRAYTHVHACVCVHVQLLHNNAWTLVNIYIFKNLFLITFSISMYIMCVSLFSAKFTNFHYFYYYTHFLQVIDGEMPMALCLQVVSQVSQHFRSSKMQATCCCSAHQSVHSVISLEST